MASRSVSVRVGGQTYRISASVEEAELQRLAAVVDDRIMALTPAGRAVTPQAILLAAIALAHEAEEQRVRADALAERTQDLCDRILARVDEVLGPLEGDGEGGFGHEHGAPAS